MRGGRWLGGLLLAIAAAIAPAHAQKFADTLRVSWRDAIPNLDPYHNPLRAGLVVAHQAFDTLVYRDPETFTLKPLLATSWKYVDPTTLEFALRRGVTFQNGDPFSADDVVYTLNGLLTDPLLAVPSNYAWLGGAEKVDDFTVRVKLKRVFPAALEYIAVVTPIWPRSYRDRVGMDAYAAAPVGAGPYRLGRVAGSDEITLERFDGYYADSPKGRPAIRRVVIREVPDAATELRELLDGKADWIWNFVAESFDAIDRVPTLTALRAESMRIGYLSLDAANRTGIPNNPLTSQKVRQAIFHAIDRETIARTLVQGGSRVPVAPCYPTQFGCDATTAVRYAYDPARARALLAEAGYPNGFSTDIISYVPPLYSDAVQRYLKAVGIDAQVTTLQVAEAVQRSQEGRNPMDLGTWGSFSINDVSAILPYFFGGGASDYVRNPDLQALIEQGGASTDPDTRRRYYNQAIRMITEQAYWVPLHTYVTTYAYSRQLAFRPFADEIPRYFLATWK